MKTTYKIMIIMSLILTTGCDQAKEGLGMARLQPDEFRVITRPGLHMPSAAHLQKPVLGQSSPFILSPIAKALKALDMPPATSVASTIEKDFLIKAKVFKKSLTIRQDLLKDSDNTPSQEPDVWAKKVFYWQKSGNQKGSPLDPYAEYQRLYGKSHPLGLYKPLL